MGDAYMEFITLLSPLFVFDIFHNRKMFKAKHIKNNIQLTSEEKTDQVFLKND